MKVRVKKRNNRKGKIALGIEIYWGYSKNSDGKIIHDREYFPIGLYLYDKASKGSRQEKHNAKVLELAENIRAEKELLIKKGEYGYSKPEDRKLKLLDFYKKVMEEHKTSKSNYGNWKSAYLHLTKYCDNNILLTKVNVDFVKGFKEYLQKNAKTSANKNLATNSAVSYFNKFRCCMNEAFNEGYIKENPVSRVKSIKAEDSHREYLTEEEIQRLVDTPCRYEVLKKAFLFSCLTGLRAGDVNSLKWNQIRKEGETYKILYRQKKTNGLEYLNISNQARELLGERGNEDEKVFVGLRYGSYQNVALVKWASDAEIKKHITFHVARHTHATLLLTMGVDIYVIKELLGHKDISTTAIYTKVIDAKRKEAVNSLPTFELNNL